MIIERKTFEKDGKSYPILVLKQKEKDQFPFSFGLAKARMIVESIDEIKKFVADNA